MKITQEPKFRPITTLKEVPCREIRTEDEHFVYIAQYDSYFKETITHLYVISKATAQSVQATNSHYYSLGKIVGAQL